MIAPWADSLFAMDNAWWETMKPKFKGEKLSTNTNDYSRKVVLKGSARNSGAAAIMLAVSKDANKIILLGYDCKVGYDGKRHWHGDHVKQLGNAGSMNMWLDQFKDITNYVSGITVVNCTRDTALKFWPLRKLEDELC